MLTDVEKESTGRLAPLPNVLRHGLAASAACGILSFFASLGLFGFLTYKIVSNRLKGHKGGSSQFIVLIYNLLLADIQQSMAFLPNADWLVRNAIEVDSASCWAQGLLLSTGDMSCGLWCLFIGIHTLATVVMAWKLAQRGMNMLIGFVWSFTWAMVVAGMALHPSDLYARAGAWCWVKHEYIAIRLWSHYIWIFVAVFGVILIYATISCILWHRIRVNRYTPVEAKRAKLRSGLMVVYPLVYVVCTLPLVSARMLSMTGYAPSIVHLCIAGVMVASNGWLHVLLYSLTRRSLASDDIAPPPESDGTEAFQFPFFERPSGRFGNTTTVEALTADKGSRRLFRGLAIGHRSRRPGGSGSQNELVGMGVVKQEIEIEVRSEPMEPEDYAGLQRMNGVRRPPGPVEDARYSNESSTKFSGWSR